jgi:hypothetical protein
MYRVSGINWVTVDIKMHPAFEHEANMLHIQRINYYDIAPANVSIAFETDPGAVPEPSSTWKERSPFLQTSKSTFQLSSMRMGCANSSGIFRFKGELLLSTFKTRRAADLATDPCPVPGCFRGVEGIVLVSTFPGLDGVVPLVCACFGAAVFGVAGFGGGAGFAAFAVTVFDEVAFGAAFDVVAYGAAFGAAFTGTIAFFLVAVGFTPLSAATGLAATAVATSLLTFLRGSFRFTGFLDSSA